MELLEWKVNTPRLFQEILSNEGTAIMVTPLNITLALLSQVAVRCSELDDPILNGLMAQLALYECGDPDSKNYNPKLVQSLIKKKNKAKKEKANDPNN